MNPNPHMHAFGMDSVRANQNFKSLTTGRQLSAEWFQARRGMVTASKIGAFLGFCETDAAKALGLHGRTWTTALDDAYQDLLSSKASRADDICMQWGREHEANMLAMLLAPTPDARKMFQSVLGLRSGDFIMEVHECGLLPMQLPASYPPMGASPDALVVFKQRTDGQVLGVMPVECKAPCPFKEDRSAGQNLWVYVPEQAGWESIPAPYFAQCQLEMLATGSKVMVLMQYLPSGTKVFRVDLVPDWCQQMGQFVERFHQEGVFRSASPAQAVQQHLKIIRAQATRPAYEGFLRLTKACCEKIKRVADLPSLKGPDDVMFR